MASGSEFRVEMNVTMRITGDGPVPAPRELIVRFGPADAAGSGGAQDLTKLFMVKEVFEKDPSLKESEFTPSRLAEPKKDQ